MVLYTVLPLMNHIGMTEYEMKLDRVVVKLIDLCFMHEVFQ